MGVAGCIETTNFQEMLHMPVAVGLDTCPAPNARFAKQIRCKCTPSALDQRITFETNGHMLVSNKNILVEA
jgi:hypothetical protein